MCLKKNLSRSITTGWVLTSWYAVITLFTSFILIFVGDHFLNAQLIDKDKQLLNNLVQNYQRITNTVGIDKLINVLERDQEFLHLSGYSLSLLNTNQMTLFTVKQAPDPESLEPITLTEKLSGGTLILSLSAKARTNDLHHYRKIFVLILVPLLLVNILVVALLNQKMLRPIRALINRVRQLNEQDFEQKVPLTVSPRSELGQLTALLNDQLTRIHQLVVGLKDTLDFTAHDLITPLTRLRLSVEVALKSNDTLLLKNTLLDCMEESERMLQLINQLLKVTAAEQRLDKQNITQLNLSQLILEAVEPYTLLIEEKNLSLRINIPDQIPYLGDPTRIRQTFINLIDNAIKYSDQGTISISAREENENWQISFEDQGHGIPAADQRYIFNRLYRSDAARNSEGHGLGLAFANAVMRAHKGRIELISTSEQGSLFTCYFPKT